MSRRESITFDDFLEVKDKVFGVYIFVLGDEIPNLGYEDHWIYHLNLETHLVRCNVEEMHMLDIGVYPKIIVIKKGKELCQFNGIPDSETFVKTLKGYL